MTEVKWAALLLCVLGTPTGARAGSVWQRELEARQARFRSEGAQPQAIVPLLGVLDLWERLEERTALVAFLDEARSSRVALPEVRAHAGYLHSLLLDRIGQSEAAERERQALGLVTRFWVVGPFDNEGGGGHATVFPPERELGRAIDARTTYAGKERAVSWRALPDVAAQGRVSLAAALRPDTQVTAYATALVRAGREGRAAVRVGSTGPIKVWVNQRLVLERDHHRPARLDQDAAASELERGWNRITVKLGAADGPWAFFLRITSPDGAPLDGLEVSSDGAALAAWVAPPASAVRVGGVVSDLGRELERRARARPTDAAALSDLGLYSYNLGADDPERHRAADRLARAAELEPSPAAYLRLAAAHADANDRRRALERGLELEGKPADRAALLVALGDAYDRARRERRAEALWLEAQAAEPGDYRPSLRLAELAAERGMPSRAAGLLKGLDRGSGPLEVLRAEASLALRRGRQAEAEQLYRRLSELASNDADALRELYGFARARGAVSAALAWSDRIGKTRPDALDVALDRAELLEGVGRGEEALAALKVGLGVAPDDARLLEREGRLLHRLGREAQAIERLRRALELKPQNPELRTYLAALETNGNRGGRGSDLARRYGRDVSRLIAETNKRRPARPSSDPARVLLDAKVTRVHSNGLSETFQQRVLEILDDRGAREQGDWEIRYTPDTQLVEVRVARVYKKNGDVVEASSRAERDLSEPWYGLYYDVRAEVIRFSGLEPGDIVDVETVVADVGRRNQFADYFGDLHFMQEELPRLESSYLILAPKERRLYFNHPRLEGVQFTVEEQGDERSYRFWANATPKVESEAGMPGFSDVAAYIHVSTFRTWEEVAAFYRGLVREQLEPNAAIIAAARAAVRGVAGSGEAAERARIRAIYDLVVRRTRYVGLEFGIHGYKPYRVTQVFARKFGDCKDKASLLVAMLKQVGVEATLVLARTRRGGDLEVEPASLAPFDHAIVYVPKYDWYLDGTAEFSGSGELPVQDQDIPVLLVSSGRLTRTPVLAAARNSVSTEWRVALAEDGSARVAEEMTISGEAAHEWRAHYQTLGERAERYGQAWNRKHPGTRLVQVEMPDLGDLERPVRVLAQLEVPRFGRHEADGKGVKLTLPALGREPDLLVSYARLSARKHDLVLGYPWRQVERLVVRLPDSYSVRRLPEPHVLETPFGRFRLAVEQHGAEVAVTSTVELRRHRIPLAEYRAFRSFCAEVDAAVGQELVVSRD